MQYRPLGRIGWNISEISFGAWAIGGDAWGRTDDAESMRALHRALDVGVNFFDTADVYAARTTDIFALSCTIAGSRIVAVAVVPSDVQSGDY